MASRKIDDLVYTTIDLTDSMDWNTITVDPLMVGATGSNTAPYIISGANGSSAIDWSNVNITSEWNTAANPSTINQNGVMELRGENADLKINGRSLMDAIDALEQRLNILVPNPELEAEWDELRELGERYRELEKKCKEKGEMWNKLKQMPPPEVK